MTGAFVLFFRLEKEFLLGESYIGSDRLKLSLT